MRSGSRQNPSQTLKIQDASWKVLDKSTYATRKTKERDRQKQSEGTEILNRPKDETKPGEEEVAENERKK